LNGRISSIRVHVEVEHPYAFMRRAFEVDVHFTRVLVTTVPRVRVKAMFMCAAFNLMRALFLLRIRQGP
jgi:IS5 family transposase